MVAVLILLSYKLTLISNLGIALYIYQFNQQPWYRPIYLPKAFPLKLLSKLEQQNVDYINKYQARYGLRYFQK